MENQVEATKIQCKYCFDVLIAKINNQPIPEYPKTQKDAEVPIFVTWKKNGQLRGCIGTFSPGKLSKILPQYALTASMRDPRFPPIKKEELIDLQVGVSLLINFKQTDGIYDWQVGKHGIIIKATHNGYPYSGTFLPQVAKEQQWDQKQTLKYLVRKAGYSGKFETIEEKIRLETYQSSKQKMDYREYVKVNSEIK